MFGDTAQNVSDAVRDTGPLSAPRKNLSVIVTLKIKKKSIQLTKYSGHTVCLPRIQQLFQTAWKIQSQQ